ncbi:MAG: hypothetical protein HQ523_16350 [Lentisphaerae bacterium]|nr:hypothetical protein [Lentisphaerota bacterium]
MRMWQKMLGVVVVSGLGLVVGCDSSDGDGGTAEGAHFLIGTWSGTWEDTRFSVSGPVDITITQDGAGLAAVGSVGLMPFGLLSQNLTGSATIDGEVVTFSMTSESIGAITGTVSGSSISGSGESTGVLSFGPVTYTGSANGSTISVDFEFTRSGAGRGTVTLTKP